MPERRSEQLELPPPGTTHWGSRRKAAVVLAIREGLITREEAYEMNRLTPEELASWEEAFDRGGLTALMLKSRVERSSC
jgi:hypothetical protein